MGNVPFGICLVLAYGVAVPAVLVWQVWRKRHEDRPHNPDLCEKCGYDLRATPARCPECGTVNNAYARRVSSRRLREAFPRSPITPRQPGPDERLVEVYQTDHDLFVRYMQEHLLQRGIQCDVRKATPIGDAAPRVVYGSHKLRVWSEDADRARTIMSWLLEEIPAERDRISLAERVNGR